MEHKNPIVAFSGGKDSLITLHLVRSIAPDTPAVFNNTGVEFPETTQFCRTIPNLIELKPEISFWECVERYGFPRIKMNNPYRGNQCCAYLKEKPALKYYKEHGIDLIFTGMTMAESRQRMLHFKHRGPYYFVKTQGIWKCSPIFDWTEGEVWQYIDHHQLAYNAIYDRGARRCGCGPCTAYLSWKKSLAQLNPKMLRQILKMQGQAQLEFDCQGEVI